MVRYCDTCLQKCGKGEYKIKKEEYKEMKPTCNGSAGMALFIVANSKAIPDYMYETKDRHIAFCNSCFEKEAVRQLKDFVNEAVELVKECLYCRKEVKESDWYECDKHNEEHDTFKICCESCKNNKNN